MLFRLSSLKFPSPRAIAASAALVALLFALAAVRAQAPSLEPTGHINDFVGVLSQPAKAQLETLANEVKQKTGAQIAVAIVPSLEGDTVENYANLLAERWGVGDKEDRGALLLLAIEDRQLRLEIGYGLEPIIPDGRAGEILDHVRASLRAGDYDTAVGIGVVEVAQIVAKDAGVELTGLAQAPASQRRKKPTGIGSWLTLLLILPFLLIPRRRRYGGWHGNALTTAWMLGSLGRPGRGGSGGGGFGSGGFGGFGGGGFGGGGASRSW